jgi:hypothetical protein
MNLALAVLMLGRLAGPPRPDKASQHLPDLNRAAVPGFGLLGQPYASAAD